MLPIKKILCPTDFSEAAYKALAAAKELAIKFDAELWIVHGVEPIKALTAPANFPLSVYYQERMKAAEKQMAAVVEERISDHRQVKVRVEMSAPADAVIRVAEAEALDLIVIATHGESAFHHLLFGSVAEKVIRQAPCPILVIRAQDKKTDRSP